MKAKTWIREEKSEKCEERGKDEVSAAVYTMEGSFIIIRQNTPDAPLGEV